MRIQRIIRPHFSRKSNPKRGSQVELTDAAQRAGSKLPQTQRCNCGIATADETNRGDKYRRAF
jgi:hypothetical protein